ncbi:MAG TPA: hypothetical protein VNZ43_04155 [Sphingomonadaceae bacterium]|jgi:hypothetical protein|nr:hypothetical protein [Sphingomonadaceae bacterium]
MKFIMARLLLAPALLLSGAEVAAAASMAVDSIERGLWRLQVEGERSRDLCIGDIGALIQIHHPRAACNRLVIANDGRRTTVHYSCPGTGWGRTIVHVLTPRSVMIDTQGIAAGAPFAFSARAHHVGDCNSPRR